MHDEDELLPVLTPLLMMRKMVVIDVDQGLLLVSLSHMKRNTIVSADTRVQLAEDWEMTLWAKRWTKFPSRPSRTGLKEQFFLGVSISQCSPSTMDERTRWSMWAISVREWLSILRTKPWCARCSHPVWDPLRWDGLTTSRQIPYIPSRSSIGHLALILLCAPESLGPLIPYYPYPYEKGRL